MYIFIYGPKKIILHVLHHTLGYIHTDDVHCGVLTYSFANPALRTEVEMALMAVSSELSSIVRLPVAPSTLRCSCSTKRVSVIVSTSTSGSVDMLACVGLPARSSCMNAEAVSKRYIGHLQTSSGRPPIQGQG